MSGEKVLYKAVFSMEHPFTHEEVRSELENLTNHQDSTGENENIVDTVIDLYLDRLVSYGILKQKGPKYTF